MVDVAGSRVLMVEGDAALAVAKALASNTRQMMLGLLTHQVLNVSELASAMNLPHSTVSFNINQLQAVGLVSVEVEPGTRGQQKLCSKRYDEVRLRLPGAAVESNANVMSVSMPIGSYRHVEAKPTCGLVSETKIIGMLDEPRSFFEPEHVYAQLLWFGGVGYVEYAFPNNLPYGALPTHLELSVEICSEAPQFNEDWPSDITLWINDVEVGTWTCPGDYGGSPSLLMPSWWQVDRTTHGLLKQWSVGPRGAMIDGVELSAVQIEQLALTQTNHIKVRLGVKDDARHRGGLNLFGRKFGNYPQDMVMRVGFDFPRGGGAGSA
ncbi:ArsR/SmtB family transcription factor [Aquabacterium sp. OR-4]|uniref:ArsR/SmtB family transcription factor n=1 Tax=Aquabacterium sp. OR-4 TaxID=2978127 RepID=UPI0021B38368|nr:helix-turn-helix domain-containing protein [Aquabacterium sp. OR-4]MDT7838006.1 helix-turn-helix domain-containing protein [Aquabacterium sp. OR-4]